jgi:hypothetical protein
MDDLYRVRRRIRPRDWPIRVMDEEGNGAASGSIAKSLFRGTRGRLGHEREREKTALLRGQKGRLKKKCCSSSS